MTLPVQTICRGFLLISNAIGGWTVALPAELGVGDQTAGRPETQKSATDSSMCVVVAFPRHDSKQASDEIEPDGSERFVAAGFYRFTKQGIDIAAATVLFVLALPVFAIIAFAVAASSTGGVFFR